GGPGGRLNPVETLQEEAICAICLDYFADPVSIGCGHNFCRLCITQLWGDTPAAAGATAASEVGMVEEEEDMWSEEEDDGDLWDDPEEEEEEMWGGRVQGDLYFDAYDVEDEEGDDDDEEEEEEEAQSLPPSPPSPAPAAVVATRARRLQTFTCPQCRKTFFQRNFRPNLQLANMVQIIRQLHPHPGQRLAPAATAAASALPGGTASGLSGVLGALGGLQGGLQELCEKHQEPLKLFCEVDEQAICVVCREARGHKSHSVVPLEEVVQDYKNKLQSHLEPLKKKLDSVLRQKSSEEEKVTELREKMKLEIKELEADFELLHQFLIGEQVLLIQQLEERFEGLLATQTSNIGQLEEQGAALSSLIAEAEEKSRQDGLQLLKDIKGTFIRCESLKFQKPEMVPVDVGKRHRNHFLQDVVMRKMERVFGKIPQADVTLDPDTAHPRLSLSLDRRSVRLSERRQELPENPKRSDSDYSVLGSQGFTGGRHYWEVEVGGGRRGWAVGAAREVAPRRKEKATPMATPMPAASQKREIWCIGSNGKKYQALTATEQTALPPGERPRRFGVYLDYEKGQLGFYNAESLSHIHTFHTSFRERIFPFFRVLAKGTRIKICS
ncbi:TRI41 ligase, partial [Rhinopomastus cyanomelas]|nr:TRI41 ligase [Rhinopomastus cyanomelas]